MTAWPVIAWRQVLGEAFESRVVHVVGAHTPAALCEEQRGLPADATGRARNQNGPGFVTAAHG